MLDVTITRTSYIVTAAELKTWLRIDHSADDSLLTNIIIPAAQQQIETATGLILSNEQAVVAVFSAESNNGFIFLPCNPVQAITEVLLNDEIYDGYVLTSGGGMIVTAGFSVSVTYNAGFPTADAELKQAVLIQAAYLYNNREATDISQAVNRIVTLRTNNLMF